MAGALRLGAVLALLVVTALFFVVGGAAASSGTGYDIGYPQCNGTFPANPGFGIVGVNDGLPFSANPCLGAGSGPSELQWAGISAGLYANTANPGPQLSSHWPNGQTSPKQCNTSANPGSNTAECAYDYGWNAAANSYQDAVNAYIALGWATAGATRTPVANAWWLDVESANSWTMNTAFNVDELSGEADYLKSVGPASVGFYANTSDWQAITGNTSSFAAYPSWVPGASSLSQAQSLCGGPGITGGGIGLTQYPSGGFDGDYQCPTTPPPAGSLAFASGQQSLTAGSTSAAMSIALSQAPSSATNVTVTTSSTGGRFATSASGSWSRALTLPVAAGAMMTPSFHYSDTRAGQPVLTASDSGYTSATQTETVTAAALSAVAVTPTSAQMRVGSQTTFTATGTDQFGNAVSINPMWSVSPALGSFSPSQGTQVTLTATIAGSGTITASAGSVSGKASITVTTKRRQGPAASAGRTVAKRLVSAQAGQPTRLPARPGG